MSANANITHLVDQLDSLAKRIAKNRRLAVLAADQEKKNLKEKEDNEQEELTMRGEKTVGDEDEEEAKRQEPLWDAFLGHSDDEIEYDAGSSDLENHSASDYTDSDDDTAPKSASTSSVQKVLRSFAQFRSRFFKRSSPTTFTGVSHSINSSDGDGEEQVMPVPAIFLLDAKGAETEDEEEGEYSAKAFFRLPGLETSAYFDLSHLYGYLQREGNLAEQNLVKAIRAGECVLDLDDCGHVTCVSSGANKVMPSDSNQKGNTTAFEDDLEIIPYGRIIEPVYSGY